jgi:hypothetical protein
MGTEPTWTVSLTVFFQQKSGFVVRNQRKLCSFMLMSTAWKMSAAIAN